MPKGVKNTLKVDLILQIYQLRSQGLTHQAIALHLNSLGHSISKQHVTKYLSERTKDKLAKRGIEVSR